MKQSQLKQIIKEEVSKVLDEIVVNQPKQGMNTPIKLGKFILNPNISGKNISLMYSWGGAINEKLISSVTRKNIEDFFGILGTKPTKVIIEYRNEIKSPRPSFFVYGEVDGETIVFVRRETENPGAGQTKVYSQYAVARFKNLKFETKENILNTLKITK